jgi:hypothetical protein
VHVRDQDYALAFYTEQLHFEKRTGMPMGPDQRWIKVAPPGAQILSFTRFCGCYAGRENDKQIHSGPSAFENRVK